MINAGKLTEIFFPFNSGMQKKSLPWKKKITLAIS
jgi:hypothetical protein